MKTVRALLPSILTFLALGKAALPADLTREPLPGQWLELPNTKIRSVLPSPIPGGSPTSIILAWNGGTVDTKRSRLIVWGGGHGDYAGNEIYALDLPSNTIKRLTNPSPADGDCGEAYADNTPTSRHTYDGLAYIPEADQFMTMGGALWPCGGGSSALWLYGFTTNQWRRMSPTGQVPSWVGNGQMAVYDPISKKVFFDEMSGLFSYAPESNTWTRIGTHAGLDYHLSAAIDSKRRRFVILGDGVRTIDLATGVMTVRNTANAPGIATSKQYPGIAYDPVADRIVAWHGGNTVYTLNLDTWQWTAINPGAGPGQPAPYQGTNGRFGYVPQYGVFAMINSIDQNAWVFRLSALPTAVESGISTSEELSLAVSPNPFRSAAAIRVNGISGPRAPEIKVYDQRGREVGDLSREVLSGGTVAWNPAGLSAGVYFVRACLGNRVVNVPLLYQK